MVEIWRFVGGSFADINGIILFLKVLDNDIHAQAILSNTQSEKYFNEKDEQIKKIESLVRATRQGSQMEISLKNASAQKSSQQDEIVPKPFDYD